MERFNSMWKAGASGCHIWQGERNPKGYGQFWADGSAQLAHKWIFERKHGALRDYETVDHKCQNTSCVRLGHLQKMSRRKNTSLETTRKAAFLTVEEAKRAGHDALAQEFLARTAHYPGGHEHDQGKHRGGGGEVLDIPGEAGHVGTGGVPLWENLSERDRKAAIKKLEGMVTDEDGNPLKADEIERRMTETQVGMVLDATIKERDWYFEHHAVLSDIAGRYGVEVGQCAGAMAATSSNKRVSENLAQVESIARTLHEHETVEVTAAGLKEYNAWAAKRKKGDIRPHPELKPGTYLTRPKPGVDLPVLPADVLVSAAGLGGKGIPKTRPTELALKATKILRGEATADEVISGPKHRSFVNNLTDPHGDRDVTHDTWDYRAKFTGMKIRREVTIHEPLYDHNGHIVKEGKNAVWVPVRDKDGNPRRETVTASVEDLQHPRYGVTPQDIFQGNNTPRKDGTINYGIYPWLTHVDRKVARDPRVVRASGGRPIVGSQVQTAVWARQKAKADSAGRRDFDIPETGTPNPKEYETWLGKQTSKA